MVMAQSLAANGRPGKRIRGAVDEKGAAQAPPPPGLAAQGQNLCVSETLKVRPGSE